jgi:hypothetical protein
MLIPAILAMGAACSTAEPFVETIPPEKETCEELLATHLPAGMVLDDRSLVPFSRTLLGVLAEYSDAANDAHLFVVSGGFLDDHLEPYDDLVLLDEVSLDGEDAQLVVGSFLERPVYAATWSATRLMPPCDTRAVISVGLAEEDFRAVLSGLESRQPGSA